MKKTINPFIVSGKIEPEYFCDRVQESKYLIKSLINGNNLVLISPRRMGKTGLIHYCYNQEPICGNYHTVFIDILHTTSLREFTFLFGKSIFEAILPLGQKVLTSFVQTLKSLSGKFSIDLVTNMPTFNLELGDITRPALTLEEILPIWNMPTSRALSPLTSSSRLPIIPRKTSRHCCAPMSSRPLTPISSLLAANITSCRRCSCPRPNRSITVPTLWN